MDSMVISYLNLAVVFVLVLLIAAIISKLGKLHALQLAHREEGRDLSDIVAKLQPALQNLNSAQERVEANLASMTQRLETTEQLGNRLEEQLCAMDRSLSGILTNVEHLQEESDASRQNHRTEMARVNRHLGVLVPEIAGNSTLAQLSFDQALNQGKMLGVIKQQSLSKLDRKLGSIFAGVLNGRSVQLVEAVHRIKDGRIVMTLTKEGQKLLNSGKAELMYDKAGNLLSTIRDAKHKQFIKQFKGVPANQVGRFAKVGNLIINAAHIVSAADMLARMKVMDGKMNLLIEGRRIDKMGELEAIYRRAQEILNRDELAPQDITELRGIHLNLMKLRVTWVREVSYRLDQIEDPKNRNFFARNLGLLEKTRNQDQSIRQKVSDFEQELFLIDFTIVFDVTLCSFLEISLKLDQDLDQLKRIEKELASKVNYLTGKYENFSLDEPLAIMQQVLQRTKHLMPIATGENALVQIEETGTTVEDPGGSEAYGPEILQAE
ncbi:MAG TPA: hypothetical protein PKV71_00945 [Calditrichia bacterium]|nr:hypothetical protein [Calditrichota bacterium]HQU74572.1 hypothetical protein [Calditrichia bacterium]HQV30405.1 hypothetical protein [Calditrichia bacterium]